MGAIDDVLLRYPIVQQLIQNLRHQGFDSHLDVRDGYFTLMIRLFAMHMPDEDATKESSMDSEALLRKKKFMQSLLGARRYFTDADFLTPR